MAWYEKMFKREEKLNPAQRMEEGRIETPREPIIKYEQAYEQIEIVNRAVNMIVDDAAEIPVLVGEKTPGTSVYGGIKKSKVNTLLNYEPNPFQDINTFKRNLILDYLIDGNIFVYFDGVHLYQVSAPKTSIEISPKTYISKFTYEGGIEYKPTEIIHIKENSFESPYRGTSRLKPALKTMQLMLTMRNFQGNFFTNGAVPGLVLKSPNTLSEKIKARMIESWTSKYRPDSGGRRPMILDGGLEIDSISNVSFKELDFQQATLNCETTILKALGVPPIMMDSGNNANLRPNMRMYYLETVLPIVRKINFGFERFFGFKINEDISNIPGLQPELRELASYYSTLVNGGILVADEGRVALGFDAMKTPETTEIRVPANIAGSAANPSEGGRPDGDKE